MTPSNNNDSAGISALESYWQPKPANGYIEIRVSPDHYPQAEGVEQGVQVVAPGGYVREHQHNDQQELILVYEGRRRSRNRRL